MKERKTKQEFGVTTTESMIPEVTAKWFNAGGRGWDFGANLTPASTALQRHSGNATFVSHAPFVGRRLEIEVGRHVETRVTAQRPLPIADYDETSEVKLTIDFVGPHSGPTSLSNWTHNLSLGAQLRRLHVIDASDFPQSERDEFGKSTKTFLRWCSKYSTARYHQHPFFFEIYPLPIGGSFVHLIAEVAGWKGDSEHLKVEVQGTKFISLLPGVTLDVSGYCGQVWPLRQLQQFLNPPSAYGDESASSNKVRLADRLFLSWRQLRGYRSVGPANVSEDGTPLHAGEQQPRLFRPLGGNSAWAISASVNMPFLLYPSNGFFSTHFFGNIGSNKDYSNGPSQWLRDPLDLLRNPSVSVGFGLVLNKFPMLSPLKAGRFELNWSLPIRFSPDGSISLTAANQKLFKTFRWGLHWTTLN